MAFNYNLLSQIKQAAAKQADAEQMRDKPQSEHLPPSTEGSAPPGGFFWRGADGRIYDLTDFSENKEIEQQFDKLFTSLPNLVKGRMGPSSGSKKDHNEKQEKKEEESEKEAALSLQKLAFRPIRRLFNRGQQPAYQQQNKYMPVFEQPAPQQQFVAPEQTAPTAPPPVASGLGLDSIFPESMRRFGIDRFNSLFVPRDQSVPGFEIPPGTPQGGGEPGAIPPAEDQGVPGFEIPPGTPQGGGEPGVKEPPSLEEIRKDLNKYKSTLNSLPTRDKARSLAEQDYIPEKDLELSKLLPQPAGAKPKSRVQAPLLGDTNPVDEYLGTPAGPSLKEISSPEAYAAAGSMLAPNLAGTPLSALALPAAALNKSEEKIRVPYSDVNDVSSPEAIAAAGSMLAPNLSGTPLSALALPAAASDKSKEMLRLPPEKPVTDAYEQGGGAIPGVTMNTQEIPIPSGEIPGITMNQGNIPGLDALTLAGVTKNKPTTTPNSVAAVKERTGGNWDNVIQAAKERGNPSVQPGFAKAPKPEPSFLDEAKGLQPRIDALREKYDMMARAGITDDAFRVKREADDLAAQQAEMRRVHYEDAKAKRENTQQDALAAIRQRARDRGLAFSEPGAKPDGAQFINADVAGPNPNARLAGEGVPPAPRAVQAQRQRQPYQRPPENTVVGAPRPDSGGPSLITSQFSGGSSQPQRASGIGYGPDGRRTFTPPAQESKIEAPAASGAKPNNFNPATGKLVGSRTNTASPNK
jgi:hypothetical protein